MKEDILELDVCRAALKCNANLIIVCNNKKTFWYYELLQEMAHKFPDKPLKLSYFCKYTEDEGIDVINKSDKASIRFIARDISKEKALAEI